MDIIPIVHRAILFMVFSATYYSEERYPFPNGVVGGSIHAVKSSSFLTKKNKQKKQKLAR